MPYIYFTEEQKRQANAVDLVELLRFRGEPLTRSGRELRMERTVWGSEWYDHAAAIYCLDHRRRGLAGHGGGFFASKQGSLNSL